MGQTFILSMCTKQVNLIYCNKEMKQICHLGFKPPLIELLGNQRIELWFIFKLFFQVLANKKHRT